MSTPFQLLLPRQLYNAMLQQAQAELPNECCGLLAGRIENGIGRIEVRYPLENELASPIAYNAAPRGLLQAAKDMRARGLFELAIYHSHPSSDPVPSATDLKKNFMGSEIVFFIVGLKHATPEVRGWRLFDDRFDEASWSIVD